MMALPIFYIPHGAGPCFFMDWTRGGPDTWKGLERWLRALACQLPAKPKSVLVVSAHWEAEQFTVSGGKHPPLIYDYSGFPEHTYQLQYPAPGDPALAEQVKGLLKAHGIACAVDTLRGLDHGTFVPLKLMFPDADVPVVQLSLTHSLDAAEHLAVGRALAPLRAQGVLIVGSGSSFHNLSPLPDTVLADSESFDQWLNDTLLLADEERAARLTEWHTHPAARAVHPREEHLLPLMVVIGAAQGMVGQRTFSEVVLGARLSGHRFA
jgi:aromatic ring-opening dioxygenase catalytic subunit (LigB family)